MSKSDIAIELFNEGYNCAQAVLSTFDEEVGLDRETAIKVSCEYGAGMAEGGICGAVIGALMVLELKFKQSSIDDKSLKEMIVEIKKSFNNKFKNINNTTICKELINYDLTTEEGFREALNENIFINVCPRFVKNSVDIIEMILKNKTI